jgi:hypothetical protein
MALVGALEMGLPPLGQFRGIDLHPTPGGQEKDVKRTQAPVVAKGHFPGLNTEFGRKRISQTPLRSSIRQEGSGIYAWEQSCSFSTGIVIADDPHLLHKLTMIPLE